MPGNPLTDPDWAPNLANTIERVVGSVRDKTTKPLLTAYRAVIFGLVAAFGGAVALVLAIIMMVRGVVALFDIGFDHHNSVWMTYLVIGAVFSVGGLVAMKKRFPVTEEPA